MIIKPHNTHSLCVVFLCVCIYVYSIYKVCVYIYTCVISHTHYNCVFLFCVAYIHITYFLLKTIKGASAPHIALLIIMKPRFGVERCIGKTQTCGNVLQACVDLNQQLAAL